MRNAKRTFQGRHFCLSLRFVLLAPKDLNMEEYTSLFLIVPIWLMPVIPCLLQRLRMRWKALTSDLMYCCRPSQVAVSLSYIGFFVPCSFSFVYIFTVAAWIPTVAQQLCNTCIM